MKNTFVTLIALCCCAMLWAVPAKPGARTFTQPDGSQITVYHYGDEAYHYITDADGNILVKNAEGFMVKTGEVQTAEKDKARRAASPRRKSNKPRKVGSINLAPRGLLIMVNFSDKSFKSDNSQSEINKMMNAETYTYNGAYGSVKKYFQDQSNMKYNPTFQVVGPYTLSNKHDFYGKNDGDGSDQYLGDLVIEACTKASADVDFSQYDNDNDGYVDFVYILYAGTGEADSDNEKDIWPCNWNLSEALEYGYVSSTYSSTYYWKNERNFNLPTFNGKKIDNFACSNELNGTYRNGIATICHEFSHVCGLPDVYDVCYGSNYNGSKTPGSWHLMDGGSYNNDGNTPPNYCCFDKYFLGWVTPTIMNEAENVTLEADGLTFRQVNSAGTLAAATNTTVQYYFENRQQTGWDEYVGGHGMLVWKITFDQDIWDANEPNAGTGGDYTPAVNSSGKLYYQLVSAGSSSKVLESQGDPFPGSSKKTSYTPISGYPLTEITEKNNVITFKFMGGEEEGAFHAKAATNVSSNQFQANWTDAEVENYSLNVYTKESTGASVVRDTTFTSNTFLSNYTGWTINNVTIPVAADYIWQQSSVYGMKASAFISNTAYAAESWLISPSINLSNATSATLAFDHAVNKGASTNLRVKVSTDGSNWSDLTVSQWPAGTSWDYISVTADLSAYKGNANVKIAFVYVSTTSVTPTWEIKNVVVSGKYNAATTSAVSLEGYPKTITGTNYVVTGLSAGVTYYYTVTPKGGEVSEEITVTTKSTVGVENVTTDMVYYVANNQLYINGLEENCTISLYDIAGRRLTTQQLCNANATVELPSAKGIYLFTISNGEQTQSYKIIK